MRVHTVKMGMANAYLLESPDGLVLVDSGSPGQESALYELMGRIGRTDLALIVITHAHFDHYGSAAAIRKQTGAPITIGAGDALAMSEGRTELKHAQGRGIVGKWLLPLAERLLEPAPTPPDFVVHDGDRMTWAGMDLEAMHTPGHTTGSISLFAEGSHVFVGDLLSTTLTPHVQRLYASDWNQILPSLQRIQRHAPEVLYPGHGRRHLVASRFASLLQQEGGI